MFLFLKQLYPVIGPAIHRQSRLSLAGLKVGWCYFSAHKCLENLRKSLLAHHLDGITKQRPLDFSAASLFKVLTELSTAKYEDLAKKKKLKKKTFMCLVWNFCEFLKLLKSHHLKYKEEMIHLSDILKWKSSSANNRENQVFSSAHLFGPEILCV